MYDYKSIGLQADGIVVTTASCIAMTYSLYNKEKEIIVGGEIVSNECTCDKCVLNRTKQQTNWTQRLDTTADYWWHHQHIGIMFHKKSAITDSKKLFI